MSDQIDQLDPEETRQERVEQSAFKPHFWRGKKLAPFSFGRRAAARRLGFGSGKLATVEAAVLIIFLCTLDGDDGIELIDSARGEGVAGFRREMEKWADGEIKSSADEEAITDAAWQIWREFDDADMQVESKSGPPDPNARRRASRRTTSRKSRQR